MLPPPSLIPLDDTNRQHLAHVISVRWRKQRRTLAVSFSLPVLFAGIPAIFVALAKANTLDLSQTVLDFLSVLTFMSLPLLILVTLANTLIIIGRFRPLYKDRRGDKKLRVPFHPEPYCIPELGRFYIRTHISRHPFIPIDQETYYWMNTGQVLYMDMAPNSKILFDIKTDYDLGIIPLADEVATPSQLNERLRYSKN